MRTHGGDIWGVARGRGVSPEEIIDFSSSINPLGLPPLSRKTIRAVLRRKTVSAYPDPAQVELKEALAGYCGMSPSNILPGNGSTELIYLVPSVLKPGKALIVEPAFTEYRASLSHSKCSVRSFLLREDDFFALDAKRLSRAIKGKNLDLLYLANPGNPAGALADKDGVLAVAHACRRAGVFLVVDEAFIDFAEGVSPSVKEGVLKFKNLIVLRSMTKFFALAGLRLGCMIAHEGTVKRFSKLIPPWTVNTLAASAGAAALADARYIERTARWLSKERAYLEEGLKGVPGLKIFPGAANFLMVKSAKRDAPALKKDLLQKRILIRDLSDFRGLGKSFFRVSVRTRGENRLLVREIRAALGSG